MSSEETACEPSLITLTVGSILCAAAPSSTVFILGRAIQGCGAAGILQGALVIITRSVPLEKRPFYISIVISAFGLCVKIGPLLGGAFTQRANWRWCFWMYVTLYQRALRLLPNESRVVMSLLVLLS